MQSPDFRAFLCLILVLAPLALSSRPVLTDSHRPDNDQKSESSDSTFKPGVLELRSSAEEPALEYYLYIPRSLKEGQAADILIYYPGVSGIANGIEVYRTFAEDSGVILLGINYDNLREIAHIPWFPGPPLQEIRSRYQINPKFFLLGFSDGGTYVMADLAARSDQIKAVVVHESGLWDSVADWDMFDRRFREADRTIPILLTCGMPEACASHSESVQSYREAGFESIRVQKVNGGHFLNAAQAKAASDFFEEYL